MTVPHLRAPAADRCRRRRAGASLPALLLAALLGCGREGDGGPAEPDPAPATPSVDQPVTAASLPGDEEPSALADLPPVVPVERPPPPGAGPHFVVAEDGLGIDHVNLAGPTVAVGKVYLRDTIGSGIAVLDADGDGRMDLYFPQGRDGSEEGGDCANRLYLADGDGRFAEQAQAWGVADRGYGFGALAFDLDADGDEDLLVTNLGTNRLFRNDGSTFSDVTGAQEGVAGLPEEWSTGAAAGDPDADGDLDVYLCNYVAQDLAALDRKGLCPFMGCQVPCGPNGLPPQADHYFRNDDGRLVEATVAAGLGELEPSYGFQPTFVDVDADGDSDLYLTNDSVFNALFVNDGSGRFEEQALLAGVATGRMGQMEAGMGLATGHVDDDGLPELYVTNFSNQSNSYYSNQSTGPDEPWFEETGEQMGCGRPTWFRLAWGTSFGDLDCDGWLDLVAANGHIYHQLEGCAPERIVYRQENDLFRGGPDGFVDWAARAGPAFAQPASHRGSVLVDLDDDGDLDLVANRLDERPLVALNDSPDRGHWLILDVRRRTGADGPTVRAVGARVTLEAGPRRWTREVLAGSSFLSSEDPRLHVGLGAAERVEQLTVALPGRPPASLKDLAADRRLRLVLEVDDSLTVEALP